MNPEAQRLAAIEEERREAAFRYRRANRPFRRAFAGVISERDRRILHAAGTAMAREERS